jgi:hypothetical protein
MPNTPYAAPNVGNYMVAKGVVTIAELDATDVPGSFSDLGNCSSFEFELNEEVVTHRLSRSKVVEDDAENTIMTGYNINFVLDEMAIANLKLFLRATLTGVNKLNANQSLASRYAVKFTSDNVAGPDAVWTFHKCKLTPNGAFSLISDDYTTMSFTGKGLSDRTNNPTSPFFDVTFATTTTTA